MKRRLSIVVALTLIAAAPELCAASDLFGSSQLGGVSPLGRPELSLSGCSAPVAGPSAVEPTSTRKDRGLGRTTLTVLGRKVLVFGRFVPSTNIAAQMGALDPPVVSTAMAMPNARGYGDERRRHTKPTGTDVVPLPATCGSR